MQQRDKLAYSVLDPEIGKEISFRPVQLEEDLEPIHDWMNRPHVIPFWNMAWPLEEIREYLQEALDDAHQRPYIGLLDGVPMSYWEAYWTAGDIIGGYYDVEREDQGIHLLIGPLEYLGKGYALPLLRAMTAFRFRHAGTRRIVTEPDIRNGRVIRVFERCGFEFRKKVDLPDKRAALMLCRRERFEREVAVEYA
jgi:acetyl CoA:N6-hydroxylysine acetyl transferase